MERQAELSAALRQIARGFEALADAVAGDPPRDGERELAVLSEWGERGLTRDEARTLLRKHGFSPQTVGGWVRGDWIERRDDDRVYITERSRSWLAEQEVGDDG